MGTAEPSSRTDALLIVDVINDFEHEDGDRLLESFRQRQPALVARIAEVRPHAPVIYANDTHGRWDGDAPGFVRDTIARGRCGELVAGVAPQPGDLFLFKPRYSAFDSTPLELVLHELGAKRLVIAGMATEMCVTHTAIAADQLGFEVAVLADACSTVDEHNEQLALEYLERVVVGCDVVRSGERLWEGRS